MNKKTEIYLKCIKPLFKGYYGYLIKEHDYLAYNKRTSNFTQFIHQYLLSEKSDSQYYDNLLKTANELSKPAKDYFDEGYDTFHKYSLVNLYSGFELAIEEFIVNIFITYSNSVHRINFIAELPKIKNITTSNNYENGKKILKIIKSILFKKEIRDVRVYLEIFKYLKMDCKIEEKYIKKFEELKQVRNCIVHNGGIIDSKSISYVPSLQNFKDKIFIIDDKKYESYFQSISKIHNGITSAVIRSPYFLSKAK